MDGALIRRIAATVPLLLVISAGVFGLLHLVPSRKHTAADSAGH